MERLAEQDPGIERLRKGERSFFRTPGNLASYRMHERAETDYRNALRYREAKARMEGEARGEAKGRLVMLLSLVRDGLLSIEMASSRAGMTRDEFAARMGEDGQGDARPD